MAKKGEPTNKGPQADYTPPQRLLIPCPQCGAIVLRGIFQDGRVKKQSPPLTPIFGEVHRCEEPPGERMPA